MGAWGTKVGDSDSVLDIFEAACWYDTVLYGLLNYPKHNDEETTLLAIAIVDASYNGISEEIWSSYILGDNINLQKLKLTTREPKADLLNDSYTNIVRIKEHSEINWFKKESYEERQKIILLLERRLAAKV